MKSILLVSFSKNSNEFTAVSCPIYLWVNIGNKNLWFEYRYQSSIRIIIDINL